MNVARAAVALLAAYGAVAVYAPAREPGTELHLSARADSMISFAPAPDATPKTSRDAGILDPPVPTRQPNSDQANMPSNAVPAQSPSARADVSLVPSHPGGLDVFEADGSAAPVAITIANIRVMSAPVIATAVDPSTGRLVVPADPTTIGWYRYGPTPGQPGSALLAGHVDHDNRPGVFYALQDVAIGSLVDVSFADGSVTHFRVATVQLVDKTDIPLNELFARSGSPRLTLVTCGGLFDWTHRTYRSNVIVSADPAPEA